uniref:Innexin n=1 Tax=Meloidogyne javanica TaxID=6303 RepID=A0A915MHU0_MELJA
MEQFSMTSCTNMLNHCGFAMEHLLTHFPGYLNCDAFFEGNKSGNNSDKIIYKKDCKINYTKVHPELASLATDSYQCLWPLINPGRLSLINDGFTNSSLNKIQVEPVIDGCYLPCRSPLFDFDNLYHYNFVVAILHFCIVVLILLTISFIVAKIFIDPVNVSCSINRSLAEGTSLNWINMTHYKTIQKAETNPEIRRRLLGEKTSAPYCQLLPQKLVWYWIFSILIFIWHFGIIIVLLTIEQNSELILKENESKMVEIDEDNVELQQLNNNISCNIEDKNDKNNADDLQHAIENEHHYDRIYALTALYYHYYFSQYSLPPQFMLPQQLGGNGNCCKFHQENLRANQQNSDQTPYTSHNSAVVQNWMKNGCCSSNNLQQKEATDKRKRAGSDPGTTRSLENQQIQDSSDRNNNKNRRHRVLHIRGAPKELQKEWRKRRELREGGKNSKNYNSSIGREGESTLFEELEKLRKDRYGQFLS